MIKKLLIALVINCTLLVAASDNEFDSMKNKRLSSLEQSLSLISENLALLGCIAADYAIQTYLCQVDVNNIPDNKCEEFNLDNPIQHNFSVNKCNITMNMLFISARTLLPDIIEQTAGEHYRQKFIQSMFLIGFYFAPVSTVAAYSSAFITKKLCKILQVSSLRSRVLEYCIGHLFGRFATKLSSLDIIPNLDCFDCASLNGNSAFILGGFK